MKALRYIIVDHWRVTGVTLSLCGHWGNLPYPDDASAEAAARADAGRQPLTIERVKK